MSRMRETLQQEAGHQLPQQGTKKKNSNKKVRKNSGKSRKY